MTLEIGTADILTPEIVPAETGLVTIEPCNVRTVFIDTTGLDPIIAAIEKEVAAFVPDLSTAGSRKAIASMAFKITKAKTYLDGLGKDLVAEYKALPTKIDLNRKAMRDRLDALVTKTRQPLTDWEAEQARIEAERLAHEAEIALSLEIEQWHEMGLLLNEKFDRDLADAKAKAEQDRKDNEAQIAREAAVEATRIDDERAQAERTASALRELQAKEAIERLDRERVAAEQRAEQAKKDADEREEQAGVVAAQRERQRIADEQHKAAQEQQARERDREHRKTCNGEALADLMHWTGLDEEKSKAVIAAIAMKNIRHITINY